MMRLTCPKISFLQLLITMKAVKTDYLFNLVKYFVGFEGLQIFQIVREN